MSVRKEIWMLKLIFLMMLMKMRCSELNNYVKKDKLSCQCTLCISRYYLNTLIIYLKNWNHTYYLILMYLECIKNILLI